MAIFSFKKPQTAKQKKSPVLNQAATSSFLKNTDLTQEQRLAAQVLGGQATTAVKPVAPTQPAPTTTGPSVNIGGVGGTAPTTAGSTTSTTSGVPTGGFTPPPINPPPTYTEEDSGLGTVDLSGTQIGKDLTIPKEELGLTPVDLSGTEVGKDQVLPKEDSGLTPVDLSGAKVGEDQLNNLALEVVNLNEARVGGDTLPAGTQEMAGGFVEGGFGSTTGISAGGFIPAPEALSGIKDDNLTFIPAAGKPSESVTMEADEELDYLRELAMANLKKLYEGGPTAEDRSAYEDTLKETEQEALAQSQRISDLSAMGLSGAGQQLQADIGRVGERETTMAMDEYDRQARQEEAQRALQAIGLIDPLQQAEFEKLAYEEARKEMGTRIENEDGSYRIEYEDGSFDKYDADGRLIAKVGPPEQGEAQQNITDEQVRRAETISKEEARNRGYRDVGSAGSYILYQDPATGKLYKAPMPTVTNEE